MPGKMCREYVEQSQIPTRLACWRAPCLRSGPGPAGASTVSHLGETRSRVCRSTPATVNDFWMELQSRRRSELGDNPAIRQAWATRGSRNGDGDVLVLRHIDNGRRRLGETACSHLEGPRTFRTTKTRPRTRHLRLRLSVAGPCMSATVSFAVHTGLAHSNRARFSRPLVQALRRGIHGIPSLPVQLVGRKRTALAQRLGSMGRLVLSQCGFSLETANG